MKAAHTVTNANLVETNAPVSAALIDSVIAANTAGTDCLTKKKSKFNFSAFGWSKPSAKPTDIDPRKTQSRQNDESDSKKVVLAQAQFDGALLTVNDPTDRRVLDEVPEEKKGEDSGHAALEIRQPGVYDVTKNELEATESLRRLEPQHAREQTESQASNPMDTGKYLDWSQPERQERSSVFLHPTGSFRNYFTVSDKHYL